MPVWWQTGAGGAGSCPGGLKSRCDLRASGVPGSGAIHLQACRGVGQWIWRDPEICDKNVLKPRGEPRPPVCSGSCPVELAGGVHRQSRTKRLKRCSRASGVVRSANCLAGMEGWISYFIDELRMDEVCLLIWGHSAHLLLREAR